MLVVNDQISVPLAELRFEHARSSGAGGQNVNKVNTKVLLRWQVTTSPSLPAGVRERFVERYRRRINNAGELVLASDRFRSQARNAEDCLQRLAGLILDVATPPKPRTRTQVSRNQKRQRLEDKRRRAQKKQLRRAPGDD